jgi:hypothetical protein
MLSLTRVTCRLEIGRKHKQPGSKSPPFFVANSISNTYPSSEIGLKSTKNMKWETYNGSLYRKGDYAKCLSPYTPAEGYYTILQTIHKDYGHCGRDKLYLYVKARTSSISKDFCAAYAECCCYSMWEKVSVLINHFTPHGCKRVADVCLLIKAINNKASVEQLEAAAHPEPTPLQDVCF